VRKERDGLLTSRFGIDGSRSRYMLVDYAAPVRGWTFAGHRNPPESARPFVSRLAGRGGIFGVGGRESDGGSGDGRRGRDCGTLGDARAFKRKWFL